MSSSNRYLFTRVRNYPDTTIILRKKKEKAKKGKTIGPRSENVNKLIAL